MLGPAALSEHHHWPVTRTRDSPGSVTRDSDGGSAGEQPGSHESDRHVSLRVKVTPGPSQ